MPILLTNIVGESGKNSTKDVFKDIKENVRSFSNRWTWRREKKRLNHLQNREKLDEIEWNSFQSLDLSKTEVFLDEENNNNNFVAGSVSMDFRKIYNKNKYNLKIVVIFQKFYQSI